MTGSRVYARFCIVAAVLGFAPVPVAAQYSPSGLSGAQLKQLHQAGVPVVAPVPLPKGFKVLHVTANSYDKTYKIVYQNKSGATIVFEGTQIYSSAAQTGATAQVGAPAPAAPTAAPKRGLFQKLFAGAAATATATPAVSNANRSGTASETEGQGMAALTADSRLIGPIRFIPVGPCLQGTSDPSKASYPGLRVTVSACNFDNADLLSGAYKSVQRV